MRKRIFILLLIFGLLSSITGCEGKHWAKTALGFRTEFIYAGIGTLIEEFLEMNCTFIKTSANYRLEGLWEKVIIPKIIKLEEMDYLLYVDCNETYILPSLKRNISHGIDQDVNQRGMELSELGVLQLKRAVFWNGIYHAFLVSDNGNEIYMLLQERGEAMSMYYIIAVDLWTGESAETSVRDGCSYNSMLEWDSYIWLDEGAEDGSKLEVVDTCHLYDSYYSEVAYCALYDYYERNGLDKEVTWIMDSNSLYVGRNGVILDIFLYNSEEEMALLVDTWNRKYTILR